MKKKMYAWVFSFLCLFMVSFMGVPAKAEVIHETDLEEYILKEMSEAHVMSMGVSIVSTERELYCASYGAETQTDRDYVLGELTQSFTAAAIMHMAEDAEISLDDTVGKYLKEEQYQAVQSVKIRELLNQTSGISLYETMSDITLSGTRGQFEAAPVNYDLLGKIIERISGVSFEEYVADNILDPLQMESTHSLRNHAEFGNQMVPGYRYYFRFPFETENDYDENDDWMQVSAGLMISDVKDMGKYLQMYLQNGGEVLGEESVSSLLEGTVPVNYDTNHLKRLFDSATRYGMGWMSAKVAGKQVYYYTGRSKNSTAGMFLLPEQKLGIAVLFNSADFSGQGFLEKLEKGIISIELGEHAEEFTSGNYFQHNITLDIGIVLLVLLAWMPIFLISVWGTRRRKKMLNIPGILIDICIHLVLPTCLLLKVQAEIPFLFLHKLYPDNFYVVMVLAGSLYLGALIKIIATIVFAVLGPKKETGENEGTAEALTESTQTENQQADGVQGKSEQTKSAQAGSEPAKSEQTKSAQAGSEPAKSEQTKSAQAGSGQTKSEPVVSGTETIVRKPVIKEVKPLADSTKEIEIKIPPVKKETVVEVKTAGMKSAGEKPPEEVVGKEPEKKKNNSNRHKKNRK